MRKRRVLNKKKLIIFLIMVFLSIMMVIALINIINYLLANIENKRIQKEINKAITIDSNKVVDKYQIDFKMLAEQNDDTVAYLKVNNTSIDYVVVKSDNNDYYLSHNFNKNENVSGWIFADYRNKFDGSDKNIIIYGHNMHDGSMLGTLKKVFDEEWYKNDDNHKIMLVTKDGTQYYKIFSAYLVNIEDYYLKTDFNTKESFTLFVNSLKLRSNISYDEDINDIESILTLSTCSDDGKKRVVVHAKLI